MSFNWKKWLAGEAEVVIKMEMTPEHMAELKAFIEQTISATLSSNLAYLEQNLLADSAQQAEKIIAAGAHDIEGVLAVIGQPVTTLFNDLTGNINGVGQQVNGLPQLIGNLGNSITSIPADIINALKSFSPIPLPFGEEKKQ